ncbi:MAG: tyrosine-type recombinase/integrase [Methyloceanibacter sp.]|uniref:tyrosine-type recombinase/integrase n=1 Tax=Methyloceanibacter sp. TaxID=1965321 RepID=UPI003D9B96C4
MAKRVRDSDLENRAARSKLKARGKPYYKVIGPGLHVGYRKGQRAGMWVVRRYAGAASYKVETIAEADDYADADGVRVLTFWQAQEQSRKIANAPSRPAGHYKVKDAIADYLVELEGRASYTDTQHRLEAYAIPALGDKHVDKLTAETIRNWHRDLAKAPRRLRTKRGAEQRTRPINLKDPEIARQRKVSANRIMGLLKAALNHAFRDGKAASDIEWRKVKPFPKVNRSRAAYLTLAQCKRLINAADEFRPLVRAALETGARYGELCRLRVDDYNPDSGTLHIRLSKSGDSRHVILTEDGQEFFGQLIAGRAGSEPIFRREWKPSQQQRPMRAACDRAKIDPPVGFHQLRHTWASHAVMGGMPLPVVARNLGHADTRMVEKHYGHLAPSYVVEAVRKHAPRFGVAGPSNVKAL